MGVDSDAELARKLRIDKSTISSWRSRGSVPERYKRILNGADPHTYATAPAGWGEFEVFAFRLALFRYSRARAEVATSGDYPAALRAFSFEHGFFRLMGLCQQDLARTKEEDGVTLSTAFDLMLHQYMSAGDKGAKEDKELLASDPHPSEDRAGML